MVRQIFPDFNQYNNPHITYNQGLTTPILSKTRAGSQVSHSPLLRLQFRSRLSASFDPLLLHLLTFPSNRFPFNPRPSC